MTHEAGNGGTTVFLKNKAGKMYRVLRYNAQEKVIRLQSPEGKEFDFPNATKAVIQKAGYTLVTQ
jgi:hypothetical protein